MCGAYEKKYFQRLSSVWKSRGDSPAFAALQYSLIGSSGAQIVHYADASLSSNFSSKRICSCWVANKLPH